MSRIKPSAGPTTCEKIFSASSGSESLLGPGPVDGVQRGAVVWEITGGDGWLRGAQGLITSNFDVGPTGEVTDDQFTRLYFPS